MPQTLDQLKAFIQAHPQLGPLCLWVSSQGLKDSAHDLAHFQRVALWTLILAKEERSPIEREEAIAAALLHDIVNVPKNSPLRAQASELCAEKAREILPQYGFSEQAIFRIADAIRCHSYSRGEKPTTALARVLQDADRLEALGSIGIMRCISTGAVMGAEYFHPEDPFAQSRPLEDSKYSIDHFYTKLLKLPQTMTTAAGVREATRRADTMRFFLEQLGKELGLKS